MSNSQPLPLPSPNALFMQEEYAAACMLFQLHHGSLLTDLSPPQVLSLLEAIRIAVAQTNCPDLNRELLVETAGALQAHFRVSPMMDRVTGCKLQEIQMINEKRRGQIRRIDPIERGK